MKITVKLFANLRELLPEGGDGGSASMEVDEETTVGRVLDGLQVPGNMKLLILVNSAHADRDRALESGDVLAVFPPIAGG
jgi:molybdopterin converting factor small subunit